MGLIIGVVGVIVGYSTPPRIFTSLSPKKQFQGFICIPLVVKPTRMLSNSAQRATSTIPRPRKTKHPEHEEGKRLPRVQAYFPQALNQQKQEGNPIKTIAMQCNAMPNTVNMHQSYLLSLFASRDNLPQSTRALMKKSHQLSSSNRGLGVPGVWGAWRVPKVCQQLGDWRMYLSRTGVSSKTIQVV